MKPTNRFYGYSPMDPPDEESITQCTHCRAKWFASEWKRNQGHCPACQKEYAGKLSED